MYTVLSQELQRFGAPRILLVGDLILDEYIQGEVKRISREAPVPIVEQQTRSYKPGGAANTLANLASLGARVQAVGVVGNDDSGRTLLELLSTLQIDTEGIVIDKALPTTTKTRISAHSRQSVMQQVLRLDMLPQQPLGVQTIASLRNVLKLGIPDADMVIISDYGNGVIVPPIIQLVQELCIEHGKAWVVDSQEDLRMFKGATLLTPNKPEAEQNLGYLIETPADLQRAGKTLLEATEAEGVLITRGDEGMSLFQKGGSYHEVPALNRTDVFDVTGAGDTVVATLSVALASGCSMVAAMQLANLAASIVVRRLGASVTTPAEMQKTLDQIQEKGAPAHD